MSRDRRASDLAAARLQALSLLSVLTISSAGLAWRPPNLFHLAAGALLPGVCVILGGLLAQALSGVGAAGLRRRARLLATLFVPVPILLAAMLPWGTPAVGPQVALGLVLVQLLLLLCAETLGLEMLAVWGAFVLAVVAAAGGAFTGAVALVAVLGLAAVFFALDDVSQKLASWPGTPTPPLGPILRDAVGLAAVPVAFLTVALPVALALSSTLGSGTAAEDRHLSMPSEEIQRAYEWLVLLVLFGTGGLVLAFRLLKGRGKDARPLVEREETHVEAEELLDDVDLDDPRYAAARGRVIRAYVRFVSRARAVGLRLEPSLTPREIEGRVRRPEEPLDRLTGLFMDARYGPNEPGPESVGEAEAASQALRSSLARRRSSRSVGARASDA